MSLGEKCLITAVNKKVFKSLQIFHADPKFSFFNILGPLSALLSLGKHEKKESEITKIIQKSFRSEPRERRKLIKNF